MKDVLMKGWQIFMGNREIFTGIIGLQVLLGLLIVFMLAWEEDPEKLP